jgi:hypothetical protein
MTPEVSGKTVSKGGPRDVFLHLLAIFTLYFSAGSFWSLIFNYINISIPDPLEQNSYALTSAYSSIRWSIASLIIVFPTYILVTKYLNKIYSSDPEKLSLRIRKWLIYLTLFVAAVIIIGDLVTLVYNLLGGDLTVRFILKVLTVLFIAGSIFSYYLWDLRKHKDE